LLVWLLIGAFAAYQRGFFTCDTTDCADAATIAINVVAGPLNYLGVDPEVEDCDTPDVPQPSVDESWHPHSEGLPNPSCRFLAVATVTKCRNPRLGGDSCRPY
jgi:hypothetical protein